MNIIITDAAGNILRTGTCAEDHAEQQAGPGEFVHEGVASDLDHKIDMKTGRRVRRAAVLTKQHPK